MSRTHPRDYERSRTRSRSRSPSRSRTSAPPLHAIRGNSIFVQNMTYDTTGEDLQAHITALCSLNSRVEILGERGGQATVTFDSNEDAKQAASRIHGTDLRGRRIFVREDRMDPAYRSKHSSSSSRSYGDRERYSRDGDRRDPHASRDYDRSRDRQPHDYRSRDHDRGHRDDSHGRNHRSVSHIEPNDSTVYVFNLPYSLAWFELKEMVAPYGAKYVDIPRNGSRSAGYAVIRFENTNDGQRFIDAFHNHKFEGRILSARFEKSSSAFREMPRGTGDEAVPDVVVPSQTRPTAAGASDTTEIFIE